MSSLRDKLKVIGPGIAVAATGVGAGDMVAATVSGARFGLAVADLPHHHRDPFDRLLVVQSDLEKLPIMTGNPVFTQYGIETVW